MKKLIYLLLAMPLGAFASSTPGSLSWDAPSQNLDGSPLLPAQIAGYDIICTFKPTGGGASSPCVLDKTTFAGASVAGSVTITYPAIGGSAEFQIRVTRVDSAQSPYSPVTPQSTKALPAVGPNPPGNLKVVSLKLDVNIGLKSVDGFDRSIAYTITAKGPGVLAGFVKVGTPCTSFAYVYRGQEFYRFVPAHPRTGVSNIAWNMPPTDEVAAPCGA